MKYLISIIFAITTISVSGQGFLSLEQLKNKESLSYKDAKDIHPDSVFRLILEDGKEIPEDVSEFKNLHRITFEFCTEMDINTELLKLKNNKNVIEIQILASDRKTPFPINILEFTELKAFTISGWKFKKLPETIVNLTNLESLTLGHPANPGCDLVALPKNIGNLKKLNSLYLMGNMEITLGDAFYNLTQLENLELIYVPFDFKRLCKKLVNLKYLEISTIEEESLEGISNLTELEELYLNYYDNLKSLGSDFSKLKKLKFFSFYIRNSIFTFKEMEKIADLPNLETLHIQIAKGNDGLFPVPSSSFCKLKTLSINTQSNISMDLVIEKLLPITSLENLTFSGFSITKLPKNLFKLSQLQTLKLYSMGLKKLNGNFKKLNVNTLEIYNIPIKELPKGLLEIKQLKFVKLGRTEVYRYSPIITLLRKNGVIVMVGK